MNTIGTFHPGEAVTATPQDLRLMIHVNVGPALWLTQGDGFGVLEERASASWYWER